MDQIVFDIIIVLIALVFFALLYYIFCRAPDNWYDRVEPLTFFDCLYISLSKLITIGTNNYTEKSFSALFITFLIYLFILIGFLEIISGIIHGKK